MHPDGHRIRVGGGFGLDPELTIPWQQQQPTRGSGVLDGDRHERAMSLSSTISPDSASEVLTTCRGRDRRPARRSWSREMASPVLPRGADGSGRAAALFPRRPTGRSSCLAFRRYASAIVCELTRGVEPCGELVRESLVVDEALLARESDGFLVEALGVERAAFDACDLGADQRRTALEVRRAVLGPLLRAADDEPPVPPGAAVRSAPDAVSQSAARTSAA